MIFFVFITGLKGVVGEEEREGFKSLLNTLCMYAAYIQYYCLCRVLF